MRQWKNVGLVLLSGHALKQRYEIRWNLA